MYVNIVSKKSFYQTKPLVVCSPQLPTRMTADKHCSEKIKPKFIFFQTRGFPERVVKTFLKQRLQIHHYDSPLPTPDDHQPSNWFEHTQWPTEAATLNTTSRMENVLTYRFYCCFGHMSMFGSLNGRIQNGFPCLVNVLAKIQSQ